jgi:NTE family protein
MDIFGVFEGGGAKGLAHVGALRAVEERGFRFCAVAGTSIGAIIASLIAAGYRSDELFSVRDGVESGLLSEDLEKKLLDDLEYRRVTRLRNQYQWAFSGGGVLRSTVSRCIGWTPAAWFTGVMAANLSFFPFLLHNRLLRDLWLSAGAVSTVRLRNWLDEVLSEKLGVDSGGVKFCDLPIELRVVATDLTKGDVMLFSKKETPCAPVADAVAASMAYPLFFKPVRIGESILVDGGLSSNAPAWVLDDLRDVSDVRIPTFAFRLLDTNETQPDLKSAVGEPMLLWRAVARFVASSLNSRAILETRRIDDFHLMELTTQVSTLDFDLVNKNKAKIVERGAVGVSEYLLRRIGPRDPKLMERALRGFIAVVNEITRNDDAIRAYLLQPIDEVNCRVIYSALLEGDADDALIMRVNSKSQALSVALREPVMMDVPTIPTADRTSVNTKYIHAARPREVKYAYCCPIFASQDDWRVDHPLDRNQPIAAICFDFRTGDNSMLLDPDIEDCITAIAQVVGEFWTGRTMFEPEKFADDPTVPPASNWSAINDTGGFFVSGRKRRSAPAEYLIQRLDEIVRRIGD